MPNADQLRLFLELFDDDAMFDLVAGAIAESRDQAPRHPDDRDSADVLNDVIAAVRRHDQPRGGGVVSARVAAADDAEAES